MNFYESQLKRVVIYGYSFYGGTLHWTLRRHDIDVVGIIDNSQDLHGKTVDNMIIMNEDSFFEEYHDLGEVQIVIAVLHGWKEIRERLIQKGIRHDAIFLYRYENMEDLILSNDEIGFNKLDYSKNIVLYAGDVPEDVYQYYSADTSLQLLGLSLTQENRKHIMHDITTMYPIENDSISAYVAEDVIEHINQDNIIEVIDEVYRILRPGGRFRITLPDYRSEIYSHICVTNEGKVIYDPSAGGRYINGEVVECGHVWFPIYELVNQTLKGSKFKKIEFLCYRDSKGVLYRKRFSGYVRRASNEMLDEQICSIIVDLYK